VSGSSSPDRATDLVTSTGPTAGAGLTTAAAEERRRRDGPNLLPAPRPHPAWRDLLAQLTHFFARMLWAAALLAVIGGMAQLGIAIAVVIVLNGLFAFAQERRAERAASLLRTLLPRRVAVRRDGTLAELDAAELVVDDVILLAAGDRVPADGSVLEAAGLLVDTSTFTGESVPDSPAVGDSLAAGTFVAEGEAVVLVTATGARTRLAGVAALSRSAQRRPSPLALELHRVVRTISTVAVGVGVAFFLLTFLLDTPATDGFIFAVGVTVALVPEGLLPTVTLSLAVGAQRMADRNALVRHLEAVETLGSTTFICTDKTGTLTRNQMTVREVWTPDGRVLIDGGGYGPDAEVREIGERPGAALATARRLAVAGRTCSRGRAVLRDDAWVAVGDPMEVAIDVLGRRLGDEGVGTPVRTFAFDPRRRRMSVVVDGRVLVKGAPDAVLDLCGPADGADAALAAMTTAGMRVLAVAERPLRPDEDPAGLDAASAEAGLTLLGLLGIEDPPRATAADALAACRRARIRVAMITGDHPDTALAIAREVGLAAPDAVVLLAADLPADEEHLAVVVDRDGLVVARAAPEDKLRIARALQARGHVVAMTGDGVNDAPALQQADIGVAMGRSGTDVAREAADLVLLDDDFATIVAAVEQGRGTFADIRRFLTYHLTDNVAELTPFVVWALSGGQLPLALGVLQILALDLGTDTLSAVALGAERPAKDVLDRPPATGRLLDATVARRAFGVLGPAEALVQMTAFFVSLAASGWRPGQEVTEGPALWAASGAAFLAVVAGQAANAFACRSSRVPVHRMELFGNRALVVAVAGSVAVGLLTFVGPVADLLDQQWPTAAGLAVLLCTPVVLLLADTADKALRRRGRRRAGPPPTAAQRAAAAPHLTRAGSPGAR
jgi:magnesium-transporting ATPase (P-type)